MKIPTRDAISFFIFSTTHYYREFPKAQWDNAEQGDFNTEIGRFAQNWIHDACPVESNGKKERVSRFECSRRNENTRRGTIIARVVSLLRISIEARSQARSETTNQSSSQFRSTVGCAKNTIHVPRVPLKNQFRKIILIGLSETVKRKRKQASEKIFEWSRLASSDYKIIKYSI